MLFKPRPFKDKFVLPDTQKGFFLNPYRFISGFSDVSAAVLFDGPVGYWKLDETSGTVAFDSSGNGRNGTIGTNVTKNTGIALRRGGNSMSFINAGSSCVTIPDSTAIRISASTQWSVECWCRLTSTGGGSVRQIPVAKWNNQFSGQLEYAHIVSGNSGHYLDWYNGINNNYGAVNATGSLSLNTVYHFVGVRNGVSDYIYRNGVLVGSRSDLGASVVAAATGNPLILGTEPTYPGSYAWVGQVSDVAIYNKALTAQQILAHYNAGL